MEKLIKPNKLQSGDKVATISLSCGLPAIFPHRYEAGIKQLEETFDFQEKQIENWNVQIAELESFFKNIQLPKKEIKLNQCTTISNLNKFVSSHLATVKANNGSLIYLPYLVRLQELKVILKV